MNQELMNLFSPHPGAGLRPDPDFDREPERFFVVLRRDQKARDDQLPHLQAGARRTVLRAHLRPDQGLRVLVRQVQAMKYKGIICEKCSVEVTLSRVRRERMGQPRSSVSLWRTSGCATSTTCQSGCDIDDRIAALELRVQRVTRQDRVDAGRQRQQIGGGRDRRGDDRADLARPPRRGRAWWRPGCRSARPRSPSEAAGRSAAARRRGRCCGSP